MVHNLCLCSMAILLRVSDCAAEFPAGQSFPCHRRVRRRHLPTGHTRWASRRIVIVVLMAIRTAQSCHSFAFRTTHDPGHVNVAIVSLTRSITPYMAVQASWTEEYRRNFAKGFHAALIV